MTVYINAAWKVKKRCQWSHFSLLLKKSSASRQIIQTAYLNLISFLLSLTYVSPSQSRRPLRAQRRADYVRISFETPQNRVQAQNSTLGPPVPKPNSHLHCTSLTADFTPRFQKLTKAPWSLFRLSHSRQGLCHWAFRSQCHRFEQHVKCFGIKRKRKLGERERRWRPPKHSFVFYGNFCSR